MPRPKSDKPKKIVRKLKDGSVWAYFYDRETGKNVGQELVKDTPVPIPAGTMAALIASYLDSASFREKKPLTQEGYKRTLQFIDEAMGRMPIRMITAVDVQEIKDALQDQPYKANQVLSLLSVLFKQAIRHGHITINPAANPGRLTVRARKQVWSLKAEQRYMAEFRPALKLAFALMLYTLQRLSDCLSMTTDMVQEHDGRLYITLRQDKTDALVGIPVHRTSLEPLLRERLAQVITHRVRGVDRKFRHVEQKLLITSPRGMKWLRRNASRAWDTDVQRADKAYRTLKLNEGCTPEEVDVEITQHRQQRRDLRRTGIVRLAERGATTPQIAALSGHSIDYCQRIIDTYLPRRTEVALGGIELWESVGPRRAVHLLDYDQKSG